MVIIKNKLTGIETECDNADVINLCRADSATYEIVEKATVTRKKATAKKSTVK